MKNPVADPGGGAKPRKERGVAILEVALVLPMLVLILFGIIEYGWLFVKFQQIGAAARLGARMGVTQPATTAQVTNAIDTYLASAGLASSGYTVVLNPSDVAAMATGAVLTVTVDLPYDNVKLTGFPVPTPDHLAASTSMTKEGLP